MSEAADKPSVPKLRFPEFQGEWKQGTLADYFTFKNGVNADKSMYGSGRKFINVMDVIADAPITHDAIIGSVEISDSEFKKNEVVYGDVLFQRSSETREEVGQSNVYLDDRPVTFGGFVIRGRPKVEIDARYFDALLKTASVRKDMTSRSGGSTRYNIGQEALELVRVRAAIDVAEQGKIADFFGLITSRNGILERQRKALEAYKKGMMQRLFSQELRFFRDDGSPFPDWEEKRLYEIGERVTERNTSEAVSFVLTNSAVDGVVSQQSYFEKDIANQDNLGGYYVVQENDFVYNPRISASAPVGPVNRSRFKIGVMSPLYTIFRFNGQNLDFFEQYFNGTSWFKYLKAVANYGARHDRMAITTSDFMAMPLPYPHPEEQKKISKFLFALDAKIEAVASQIEAMQYFKKGLLQQMFI